MDLAKNLIRMTVRAFYTTEHVLIVDALAIHSTLTDNDLAQALGMQPKVVRRLCGTLKADGLISSQARGEKKEGAPPTNLTRDGQPSQFKERLFTRDWYYLNFHHAIDCLKYRMHRLSRHIESMGAPTTEKKDRICPRCKSTYTELEVMDNISSLGEFLCHKCDHVLDEIDEADMGENESMKRLNDQLSRMVDMMRQIDSTDVPENDFETALSHQVPIQRGDWNPARKMQIVDHVKPSLANSKGLAIAPEEITVTVLEDGDESKMDSEEAARKRAQEAKQNMLPEWISKSTITGDITSVGAKEAAERAARDAHTMGLRLEDSGEEKKVNNDDDGVMDSYWAELKAEQEREARQAEQEEEEEDDDDDEDEGDFEDVVVGDSGTQADTSSSAIPSINVYTPATMSSTATDDEGPAAKKAKTETSQPVAVSAPESTQESKNGESDEDEFEFEDV